MILEIEGLDQFSDEWRDANVARQRLEAQLARTAARQVSLLKKGDRSTLSGLTAGTASEADVETIQHGIRPRPWWELPPTSLPAAVPRISIAAVPAIDLPTIIREAQGADKSVRRFMLTWSDVEDTFFQCYVTLDLRPNFGRGILVNGVDGKGFTPTRELPA